MAKKETKKTAKKQTAEEKALALTSDGIFRKFESVIPEGATTQHVLEAAMTLIGSSLVQMNATKQDLRNVIHILEDYVIRRVELRDAAIAKAAKECEENAVQGQE